VNAGIADIAVNGRQGKWRSLKTGFGVHAQKRNAGIGSEPRPQELQTRKNVPGLSDVASRSLDDGAKSGVLVRSRLARRSLLEPKRQGEVGRSRRR
jgi:hypothetical protein